MYITGSYDEVLGEEPIAQHDEMVFTTIEDACACVHNKFNEAV